MTHRLSLQSTPRSTVFFPLSSRDERLGDSKIETVTRKSRVMLLARTDSRPPRPALRTAPAQPRMAPQRAVWPLQARVSALSGSPAARAFSLGYTATVLPTLLKIVLGALLSRNKPSAKRGSEVARLLVDAIVKGFSPTGMATACAIALGGGAWGESRVELLVRRAYLATLQRLRARKGQGKNTKPGQSREEIKARATVHEKRIQALSTLLATTFSSLVAITVLQSSPAYARSRTAPIEKDQTLRSQTDDELEVPFVASPYPQLFAPDDDSVLDASSTVPTTRTRRPENFAVQQSPTLHISLFMLVRALDSVVRGLYELRPVTVATPRVLKLVASHADTLVFGLSCWRIMVHPVLSGDER